MGRQVSDLIWLGGNPGDGWYEMTEGLVELLNGQSPSVRLSLVAGGGEENLLRVQDGEADIGMSIDVVVGAGFNGGPPFESRLSKLNILGTGWSALPYNLLKAGPAQEDLGAAIVGHELKIGAPPKDTTDELMFQRVISYYGTTYEDISQRGGRVLLAGYDTLVSALDAGEIDYVFGATTLPAPSIAKAAHGRRDVELVALPEDLIEYLIRHYGCSRGVIPSTTYPGLQETDIATCFAQTTFVVSVDAPETAMFDVTMLLLSNLENLREVHPSLADFNPYTGWRNVPAPVHPGAARAYRQMGFMS